MPVFRPQLWFVKKKTYKLGPLNEDDQKCEKRKYLYFIYTLRLD